MHDPYSGYNASRNAGNNSLLCQAPFNNMYFNVHGQAAPCWLTLDSSENIAEKTIKEIWTGERFTRIRRAIRERKLSTYCSTCEKNIQTGNYVSVLAKLYDLNYPLTDFPVEMEFELSNICNLECVMCKGELSSSIREKREHLPKLSSPYTQSFVEQLKDFLPYLKEAKFLGGEPFLIPLYYDIWDSIIKINPEIKITVTTNGTVWNKRVIEILQALHCNIIISIDSFNSETYKRIRIGGNLEKVLENFEQFRSYCKSRNTYMGISINPLRKNWHELKSYVEFCNEKDVPLWFNTIVYPYTEALWTLSSSSLKKIHETLSQQEPIVRPNNCSKGVYQTNTRNYDNFIEAQLKNWWEEAEKREHLKAENAKTMNEEELFEKLKGNIRQRIFSDAYIPSNQLDQMASKIESKINTLTYLSRSQKVELFVMPETEAMLQIEATV